MSLKSWISYPSTCEFPIQNIPFGVYESKNGNHICSAIGDYIIDIYILAKNGIFPENIEKTLLYPTLNEFMNLGRKEWKITRSILQDLFLENNVKLQNNELLKSQVLHNIKDVKMVLPANIGDYTDFYSSRYHAYNVGVMFRGIDNALQPNWLHLPVGYHGRSSSIVVSGTDIIRPMGQLCPDEKTPVWGQCMNLDFELELACYVGPGNKMGERIPIESAEDHIFGISIMNDWSARDIQKWEYIPLGPFNAKNFATTISPWIITLEALEPFKVLQPTQDPPVLPYLKDPELKGYDIQLNVSLSSETVKDFTLSKSNGQHLYWSFAQQLAHHTSTGCPMRSGDMLGSGTISGPEVGSYGSLLEICWKGTKPLTLPDGSERKFIKNGDEINITGFCQGDGYRIGFGECAGKILPPN